VGLVGIEPTTSALSVPYRGLSPTGDSLGNAFSAGLLLTTSDHD
jgi:hypothetical protein